jgi:hypothetical protein
MWSYFSVPWMPKHGDAVFWVSVIGCFGFWLAAYVLIIRRGFLDRSYGMPIGALCGNIAWEFMFSCLFLADYLAIRLGNFAWLLLDIVILYTVLKYGREDFTKSFYRRWLLAILGLGIAAAVYLGVSFVKVYQDTQGFFTGWIQAFLMSILFISMLVRRDSLKGQSIYIALCMFLGNVPAYFWVEHFPDKTGALDSRMNLAITLCTCFFNLIYIAMIYRRCRQAGINPWKRF